MAAKQVTSANSNSIFQAGRSVFRAVRPYYTPVGTGLVLTGITNPRITKLSATRIVVANDSANTITTYDFNGSTWSQVGNAKSITFTYPAICAMTSTRIAVFSSSGTLQTYDFNGTDWNAIGNGLVWSSYTVIPGLAALSSTKIVSSYGSTHERLDVYTFDGTNWSIDGYSVITGLSNSDVCALTSTRIILAHSSTSSIRCYDWNGSSFSQVGSSLTPPGGLSAPSITNVSDTEFIVSQYGTSTQFRYSFVGTTWTLLQTITKIGRASCRESV